MYNQLTPEIIEEIKKVSNNVFLGEEIMRKTRCRFMVRICQI